ncbi:MAG: ABC transporter, partial [Planctomycetota bacterium]|nr:ABC transporter [Planctomycetota bacterium]
LAGLRGRGEYTRPFDRVEALRHAAESEYLAEQERLEAEIQETERRLGQLQQAQAGSQATLLLSPEQEAEVDQLQDKVIAARKQLRLVQLNLRTDIEQLGTNLMLFNTIVWPLVVAALSGMIFLMRRKVS